MVSAKDALLYPVQDRTAVDSLVKLGVVTMVIALPLAIVTRHVVTVQLETTVLAFLTSLFVVVLDILLLVPAVIIVGYLLLVCRSVLRGMAAPPAVGSYRALVRIGAAGSGVIGLYMAVPFLLLVSGSFIGGVVGVMLMVVGGVTAVIAVYLLPAALTHYVAVKQRSAIRDVSALQGLVLSEPYLKTWVRVILLQAALIIPQLVAAFLMALTIIGILALPAVIIYPAMVYTYLFTDVYRTQHRQHVNTQNTAGRPIGRSTGI